MVDNAVIRRPLPSHKTKKIERKRKIQHLCLDKIYNSESEEQELIKREYVLHIPSKGKRRVRGDQVEIKITVQHCSNRKKHSAKRWVIERNNSWHD